MEQAMTESILQEKDERVRDAERKIASLIIVTEAIRHRRVPIAGSFTESFFKDLHQYLV